MPTSQSFCQTTIRPSVTLSYISNQGAGNLKSKQVKANPSTFDELEIIMRKLTINDGNYEIGMFAYFAFDTFKVWNWKIIVNRINFEYSIITFESLERSKTILMIKTVREYHPPTIKFTCPTITHRKIEKNLFRVLRSVACLLLFAISSVPFHSIRDYLLQFSHFAIRNSSSKPHFVIFLCFCSGWWVCHSSV